MLKRIVSLVLTLVLVLGMIPWQAKPVEATSYSADDAINWVKSKKGQAIDYDGAYGAQCVDLIMAYYKYLIGWNVGGNAKDYRTNTLPSGWSRVKGGTPQKGDIIIFCGDSSQWGHVAIYESDYSTWHQNYSGQYVRNITTYYKNIKDADNNGYWGYIRPDFNGSVPPDNIIDTRYPTPFGAYTLLWNNTSDGKTWVSSSIGGANTSYISNGYNNEDDHCIIEEVYTNGWCKVSNIPGVSGARYCKLSVFVNVIDGYQPWWITAPNWAQAYRRWDTVSPRGYIDAGDSVCVISETADMYQVIFPTSDGYRSRWVVKCDLGHGYKATVTKPTCTNQGYTTHKCTVCGTSYKDTYTNATGHKYTYAVNTKPTTSAAGSLKGTCSKCSGTTTVTLPKLNTTDYTYKVTKAATCTAAGTGQYTWKTTTYGSFSFDASIAKLGHSYTSKVTAPTCTAQGYITHTCGACGHSYKDTYTNATGHKYTYVVNTKPTTSAAGSLKGTCSKCSGTTTVTLPKLNTTDYTYKVTKAATCTAAGTGKYTWKTTTYGSFSFDASIAKLGHSYTSKVTASTCTAQGYTTHTCGTCGDSYTDDYVDALGHSFTNYSSNGDATCTADGTKTAKCDRCDATDTVTDVGSKTGHDMCDWYATKKPTCTEKGTEQRDCENCDYYETREVAATGHSYTEKVTASTCTEMGYTTHTCACGDSYKDAYTDQIGHNYSNGSCTHCGATDPNYVIDQNAPQIVVETVKSTAGKTVTMDVELKNNPGVAYLLLTLDYDKSALTLVSVENGKLISDMDEGVNLAWSSNEDCTSDGVLCKLTFQISEDAQAGQYLVTAIFREAYDYNNDTIKFSVVDGTIEVAAFVYGDANGDGTVNGRDVLLLRKFMANYDFDTGTSSVEVTAGADANGDGVVNGRDVLLLRKYMANYDFDTGLSSVVLGPQG